MSKLRNLDQASTVEDNDYFYFVITSVGVNGGRKIRKLDLKEQLRLTDIEIKTAYENNDDTNAFTDDEKTKLSGIEAGATADGGAGLAVTQGTGFVVNYSTGRVILNGIPTTIASGNLILNSSITNGTIYVDLDGTVKQTGSETEAPSLTTPLAKFSTDLTSIVALDDARSKNNKSLIKGSTSNITTIAPNNTKDSGNTNEFADASHTHDLTTASAVGIDADSTSTEGTNNSVARSNHTHAIATAAPVTVGTSNSEGDSAELARANHVHSHGDQAGGTLHDAVTTSVNGFMSAADKTKLDKLVFGFLNYSNSGTQSTTLAPASGYTNITLDTDNGSLANSLLTKTSPTQFRTDFTGYIEISYKIEMQNVSANDKAARAVILKNGTALDYTRTRSIGKNNTDRYNSAAGTFKISCTTNDVFTFGFSNAEAGTTDTISIFTNGATFSIEAVYKTA